MAVNSEVLERFTPMSSNDLVEVFNDGGFLKALGLAVPSLAGGALQTYKPKPTKEKSKKEYPSDDFDKEFKSNGQDDLDKWFKS